MLQVIAVGLTATTYTDVVVGMLMVTVTDLVLRKTVMGTVVAS
jgi:hypothetical protein